ncbi:MAG: BrnT family toxin [Thiotrichaceae bacterium]|nr:BrnT family toxin [Thiotrichaceae bacterium]
MDFKWDETKAHSNKSKHNISFFEATEVFSDEYAAYVRDPDHSYREERYLVFGMSAIGNYLVVSYTERHNTIRIISARHMTRQERKAYEQ